MQLKLYERYFKEVNIAPEAHIKLAKLFDGCRRFKSAHLQYKLASQQSLVAFTSYKQQIPFKIALLSFELQRNSSISREYITSWIQECESFLPSLFASDPLSPHILFSLALSYWRAEQYNQASLYFKQVIEIIHAYPHNSHLDGSEALSARFYLANSYFHLQDYVPAISHYSVAVTFAKLQLERKYSSYDPVNTIMDEEDGWEGSLEVLVKRIEMSMNFYFLNDYESLMRIYDELSECYKQIFSYDEAVRLSLRSYFYSVRMELIQGNEEMTVQSNSMALLLKIFQTKLTIFDWKEFEYLEDLIDQRFASFTKNKSFLRDDFTSWKVKVGSSLNLHYPRFSISSYMSRCLQYEELKTETIQVEEGIIRVGFILSRSELHQYGFSYLLPHPHQASTAIEYHCFLIISDEKEEEDEDILQGEQLEKCEYIIEIPPRTSSRQIAEVIRSNLIHIMVDILDSSVSSKTYRQFLDIGSLEPSPISLYRPLSYQDMVVGCERDNNFRISNILSFPADYYPSKDNIKDRIIYFRSEELMPYSPVRNLFISSTFSSRVNICLLPNHHLYLDHLSLHLISNFLHSMGRINSLMVLDVPNYSKKRLERLFAYHGIPSNKLRFFTSSIDISCELVLDLFSSQDYSNQQSLQIVHGPLISLRAYGRWDSVKISIVEETNYETSRLSVDSMKDYEDMVRKLVGRQDLLDKLQKMAVKKNGTNHGIKWDYIYQLLYESYHWKMFGISRKYQLILTK